MANVAITSNTPTSNYNGYAVPVTFYCSHADGVDPDTISLSTTDPLGNTAVALDTLQAWQTGYDGDVVADGDNYSIVLRVHPVWFAGTWTASATADSNNGGESTTLAWNFGVTSVLTAVLETLPTLMDGSAGAGRTMPINRFRYFDSTANLSNALAASGKVHPYVLTRVGMGDALDIRSNVSGDYVYSSHIVRMSVLYAIKHHKQRELEENMSDDEFQVRRVLEWPDNWCVIDGWVGCEVIAETTEEVGEDAPEVVAHHLDLLVQCRELHT